MVCFMVRNLNFVKVVLIENNTEVLLLVILFVTSKQIG